MSKAVLALSLPALISLVRPAAAREGLDLGGGWFMEFGGEYTSANRVELLRCIDPVYQTFRTERGSELQRLSLTTMPMPMQREYMNEFIKQWRDMYLILAWQQCDRQLH
jgi:hypothetical protein